MSRKREQADIIYKLGQLFGPVLKAVENPSGYDQDEKARIVARYLADMPGFLNRVHDFTRSEKGHDYMAHWNQIHNSVYDLHGLVINHPIDSQHFRNALIERSNKARDVILSIPVPLDSTIYEARTPFSTYCLVKDICSTAKAEIIWLDRYFDQGIFHRYFADVPSNVLVTLITWPQSECKGARDTQRYQEFMDVSKLFAQERGPAGYRLVTNQDFHDRWLCCDDKLFTLGGSIKDIAKDSTFTLSRLDSTPENRKHFDDAVANGVEVFGKRHPIHP